MKFLGMFFKVVISFVLWWAGSVLEKPLSVHVREFLCLDAQMKEKKTCCIRKVRQEFQYGDLGHQGTVRQLDDKHISCSLAYPVVLVVKNPPASAGDVRDTGLIPGSGRFPGGGHGKPLQYSCLGNSMDKGAWQATVHRVTKSQT